MKRPTEKLALGTVQLGLSYGINNHFGKPDQSEVFRILDEAARAKILYLDSAEAYGDSLQSIGLYLRERRNVLFKIISKFIGGGDTLESRVDRTLNQLGVASLYAYMFHRYADYQSGNFREELRSLKEARKIEHIGISLYALQHVQDCLDDPDISVIQIPLNPFDATEEKIDLLKRAKTLKKEIHVRSVYLQGLLFKQPTALTGNLTGFRQALTELHKFAHEKQLSVQELCLNFALHQSFVDHVVIGVETEEQLKENISSIIPEFSNEWYRELKALARPDPLLLDPSNWKP